VSNIDKELADANSLKRTPSGGDMPLTFIRVGQSASIKSIQGKDNTKNFLGSLGFTAGETVTVISENGGSYILCIKGSRVALDRSMAMRIHV
jgi:ferrous iron transport protein A